MKIDSSLEGIFFIVISLISLLIVFGFELFNVYLSFVLELAIVQLKVALILSSSIFTSFASKVLLSAVVKEMISESERVKITVLLSLICWFTLLSYE